MTRQKRSASKRGYLLLEVGVAGAMLTVALGSIIGLLAQAQVDLAKAAHRDRAVGIAAGKVSELEADPARGPIAFGPGPIAAPLGPLYPGYTWAYSLVDVSATVGPATLCDGVALTASLYRISATVQYPTRFASSDDQRDGLTDGMASVVISRLVP